jgi:hypothetical protein
MTSRAPAKRVARRFEPFERVEIDFAGVSEIEQAFADVLFCVFGLAHPQIRTVPVNTAPSVDRMIRRAVAAAPRRRVA